MILLGFDRRHDERSNQSKTQTGGVLATYIPPLLSLQVCIVLSGKEAEAQSEVDAFMEHCAKGGRLERAPINSSGVD